MSLLAQTPNPYWLAAGWTMFHFLWMGTLVGLLAVVARGVLRRSSPNLRYAVALWCLAALVVIPLGLFWYFATHAAMQQRPFASMTASSHAVDGSPVFSLPAEAHWNAGEQLPVRADTPERNLTPASTAVALVDRGLGMIHVSVEYLPWAWLVGSPLTLVVLLTGLTGVERLRRQCDLLTEADLPASFRSLAQSLGIVRDVTVGVTERVVAPMLLGVLRPLILLPPAILGEWSPQQVEMVLLHELAHIRRHDNLVNFLQRVVESLLFFHPAVWKVSRWVRLERELCCDAVVLRHFAKPRQYAETLASLALPGLTPRFAMASLANHQLVDRIRHIMNSEDRSMKVSFRLTGLVAVLVVSTSAVMMAWAQQPAAAEKNDGVTATQSVANGQNQGVDTAGKVSAVVDDPKAHGQPTAGEPSDMQFIVEQYVPGADQFATRAAILYLDSTAHTKPWSANQATGAPNTPEAGDYPTAWAAREPDSADECLTVRYEAPVDAVAVLIYETFNPGAISQIRFYSEADKELQVSNFNPGPIPSMPKRVLVLPIPGLSDKVARVEMQMNSSAVPGWNEIDAVGLVDSSGKTHWAAGAEATSSFADVVAQMQAKPQPAFPRFYSNISPPAANTQRDRALLEQLQAEVRLMKQQQQVHQNQQQEQLQRIDQQIEEAFAAREEADKKYEEISKRFGDGHPARQKVEAEKRQLTDIYESLLRKKGYLRSPGGPTAGWISIPKPEPDRVERLEEEVRSLRKVLEDLQQHLKQQPATKPASDTGAGQKDYRRQLGDFFGSGVILLDQNGAQGGTAPIHPQDGSGAPPATQTTPPAGSDDPRTVPGGSGAPDASGGGSLGPGAVPSAEPGNGQAAFWFDFFDAKRGFSWPTNVNHSRC